MWLSLAIKIMALSTQLHWSSCYMHWEVAGIGKYHPLLCAFAALAECRFSLAVFWHPRLSDRQLTDADGVISLVASEKCSRLGFGSSRMLLSWQ